jgi:hypothetical protein
MDLIIPESVGGTAKFTAQPQKVVPVEEIASQLVIPASVGGPAEAEQQPSTVGGDFYNRQQPEALEQNFPGASVIEPALTVASSMIAEPIAGIAGIAASLLPGEEGAGSRAVESTREALTFKPKTESGTKGLKAVGNVLEPIGNAIQSTERVLGDAGFAVAGPTGGAIGATIPTALMEALGLGLARRATRSTGRLVDNNGAPTPELQSALDSSGIEFSDLAPESLDALNTNRFTLPEEVLRAENFRELGVPATAGDITQDFTQQATEARLVESAADDAAGPIRTLRLNQSRGLQGVLTDVIDNLGVPSDVGDSLKEALSGRKKLLSKEKNELYKAATDAAPEIRDIPLITDSISDALLSPTELRRLNRISGNQIPAIKDLMTEFGINKNADDITKFIDDGGEILPLNIGNFEEFRQAINQIERSDTTGSAQVVTGPIKRALDEEASLIDDAIKDAGIEDVTILENLKEARSRVVQIKTEFSPQSITGKLIGFKRDGVTPVIESSKVFKEILGSNKAPELFDRTLSLLRKSGEKGAAAINDLQAASIMQLLDDAFKAQTRKIGGEKVIGGTAFQNSFDALNQGNRLDKLFSNNKPALSKIKSVSRALKDITPPSGAVPKGSAGVILDTLNNLGLFTISGVTGIGPFVNAIRIIGEKGADRGLIDAALKGKPQVKKALRAIQSDFPQLAAVLGVTTLKEKEDN